MWWTILISVLIGICGTFFGSLIAVLTKRFSAKMTGYLLAFAAGVMISLVFFDLIPEAVTASNLWIVLGGISIGLVFIIVLDFIIEKFTKSYQTSDIDNKKNEKIIRKSGIVMLVAVSIHNIPLGIAIGAGGIHNAEFGIMLGVMFALHNIPEGMAVSAPLLAGGMRKHNVILLGLLSGVPTVLGAVIGFFVGSISNVIMSIVLSAISGIMLYTVFVEILPEAFESVKFKKIMLILILGILIGFVLMGLEIVK